jgi:predicted metal-dependent enzyme (double-stranded beta helix superfamily)
MSGTTLLFPAPQGRATSPRSTGAAALAVALSLRTDFWTPLVGFRDDTRWTRLLEPADLAGVLDPDLQGELADAEVWLLSWLPGQGTDLHDHGPSSGAFAVAAGTLTERVVTADRRGRHPREAGGELAAGRARFFGPHYVHQVHNAGGEPAVSVHVYAPRLRVMNTYRVDGDRLVRTGTEQAGVDW